jgi:hypothetical protein
MFAVNRYADTPMVFLNPKLNLVYFSEIASLLLLMNIHIPYLKIDLY